MSIRRWLLMSVVVLATLAGPGPVGGARADAPSAQGASAAAAPEAPSGGVVGTGTGPSCDETALENALAGGGSVTFDCGGPKTILILSQKTITTATTIDGGGIITITGGLATRLFQVQSAASLLLRDIVLDAGYSPAAGGGAIANAGTLGLDDVHIQYSQTGNYHSGGAIFTSGPTFISHSRLHHNTSNGAGALYAIGAGARVEIFDSTFDFNQAIGPSDAIRRGGAIWVGNGAQVHIQFTLLSNNLSEGDGGALYNEGSLTSSDSQYSRNQTTLDPNASFRGYGGAIASTGSMTMTRDYISQNDSRFGGGLFVSAVDDPVQVDLSVMGFYNNDTVYSGGGLYTNSGNVTLRVIGSTFEGNEAEVGGGLSRSDTNLSIIRSSFGENVAENGGGLANSAGVGPGSEVVVLDSTFYSNTVDTGQGGAILNTALMELRNLTLEGNSSGVSNSGSAEQMQMANTVLHNVGLNCDGDGTKPVSLGGNFSTDNSCNLASAGDAQGITLDPLLGPIDSIPQYLTKFFIPLPGSPLINTAQVACSLHDQRNAARPNACDRGAIEFGGLLSRVYVPLVRRNP
jgi:hypothetical protein